MTTTTDQTEGTEIEAGAAPKVPKKTPVAKKTPAAKKVKELQEETVSSSEVVKTAPVAEAAEEKISEEKTTTPTGPTFADRGLRPTILESLTEKGYTVPTPIQELTFKHFTDGHHIVGESQTGSGKTAAFLLPLLNAINLKEAAPQVLVLSPTRELALQTEEEAFELTRGLFGAKTALVCGGLSFKNQIQRVQRGANVIIGTPGRVMSMIDKRIIQTNQIHYLVLDEVDRMLDMGFIDEVEEIRSRLPKTLRALCFSATMPHEVKALFDRFLPDGYQHIKIEKKQVTVDQLDHSFVRMSDGRKLTYLEEYLTNNEFNKILVFAQTKRSVDELQNILNVEGYEVFGLHGDVDQYERINAMKAVKASNKVILVATDVASRGLNLNDIDLVVNFDMPQDPEDYVHRVGRTARAGKAGKAIMFVTPSEDRKLKQLERANKLQIKEYDMEGNLVHRQAEQQRGSYKGGGGRRRQPRTGGGNRSGGGSYAGGGERRAYAGGNTGGNSAGGGRFGDRAPRTGSYAGGGSSTGGERRAYAGGNSSAGGERRPYSGGGNSAGGSRFSDRAPRAEGSNSAGGERRPYAGGSSSAGGSSRFGDRAPRTGGSSAGGERRPYSGEQKRFEGKRTEGGERRSYGR